MTENKRILFVDDEKNVLDGLRRILRSRSGIWDMTFALGGEEALKYLGEKRFDVIVSDMRMPGMSGGQLLTEVRKRYPRIVRLALSGQADREEILKHTSPIHQFLQKPCDAETLVSTIKRTIELGDLFDNENLKEIISGLVTLPSLPSHQEELTRKFKKTEVSPQEIGKAISKDLAMTTKILQLVNSAFFGLRRHVATPADAVVLLGLDTVRSLVMTMQVFSQVSQKKIKGFSQDALLSHSAAVAVLAKKLAATEGMDQKDVEDAYLAGLLHDVGKLVLATKLPEQFKQAMEMAKTEEISVEEAERQVIGTSHGEVGGYLLGLWAFQASICDAAVYHHCPDRHCTDGFTILTAVHVANAIVHHDPKANDAAELNVDNKYLKRLGIWDRLTIWQDKYQCAA